MSSVIDFENVFHIINKSSLGLFRYLGLKHCLNLGFVVIYPGGLHLIKILHIIQNWSFIFHVFVLNHPALSSQTIKFVAFIFLDSNPPSEWPHLFDLFQNDSIGFRKMLIFNLISFELSQDVF